MYTVLPLQFCSDKKNYEDSGIMPVRVCVYRDAVSFGPLALQQHGLELGVGCLVARVLLLSDQLQAFLELLEVYLSAAKCNIFLTFYDGA